jgi:hypothetical protein
MDDLWRTITCWECRGYGVVSVYSANDFEGPGECGTCDGSGAVFVRPGGHCFHYPGGPACGMVSPEWYQRGEPYRPDLAAEVPEDEQCLTPVDQGSTGIVVRAEDSPAT